MPESSARNRSETRVREALVVKLEPLAGFTVAVTADRRADEQAALLARLGATVLHGPVIRTESVTDRIALLDAARSLVEQRPDVVILTTAVGVRAWLTEADSVEMGDELLDVLSGPVVLARGRSVSGVAMAAGLDVTWTAPTGRFAELLAHLESEQTRRGPDVDRVRRVVPAAEPQRRRRRRLAGSQVGRQPDGHGPRGGVSA